MRPEPPKPRWMRQAERFFAWSDETIRRCEQGDEEAENWVMFVNLTVITALVILVVGLVVAFCL